MRGTPDYIDFFGERGYFIRLVPGISIQILPAKTTERLKLMITFTPSAISKVKEVVAERDASLGLRITVLAGCSGFHYQMTLDKEQGEGDESLDFEGLKVLVDTRSMTLMDGTKIDYVEEEDGSGFTFDNPNKMPDAQAGCKGCGNHGSGGVSTE